MPRIGIFWVHRGEVLGRAVALSEGESSIPGVLDSPDNHSELWEDDPELLAPFPELRGREYFAVPRGRVLWQVDRAMAIIYMDSRLFNETTKAKIAAFFDLNGAEILWRTDPHYATGS